MSALDLLENVTPMMRQYLDVKDKHRDALLFFRMGDFYELFFDDARVAAPILEIALTKRGKSNGEEIPMCGVPYHSVDIYIQRLIKAGLKVAICEQLESPEEAKKRGGYKAVVQRDVTRVITAGTLTEDNLLEGKTSNYLASIVIDVDKVAIAYVDISTLDFQILSTNIDNIINDLVRLNPSEVLVADHLIMRPEIKQFLLELKNRAVFFPDSFFEINKCQRRIKDNFNLRTLESLGSFSNQHLMAAGSLIEYLCITQKKERVVLHFPKLVDNSEYVVLDKTVIKSLEIFESQGDENVSLFKTIDKTLTNPGGRLLKQFLAFPVCDIDKVNSRLDYVELFINNHVMRGEISQNLKTIPDVERALSRLVIGRGTPRELYAIQEGLAQGMNLSKMLEGPKLSVLADRILKTTGILSFLNNILIPRGMYLNQTDFINRQYHEPLAQLCEARDNTEQMIYNLREEYVEKTGIPGLKIEFNNVLGYYIEVTKAQAVKVRSEEFIHRQTMVNGVRYITNRLRDLESQILELKQKIADLETQIFAVIVEEIAANKHHISTFAKTIAFIDVMQSLALLAIDNNYCRPELNHGRDLEIIDGRHPVVESCFTGDTSHKFISNDCVFKDGQKIWLITGPNMSGKSTFLRQNALIAILAHVGSYVPAKKAVIGVIDRIFSRIGAGDDLAKGYSTFLVEMIEAATILNQATDRSLIILDEIGRGTSTYDGIAIAHACVEYIHDILKSRTLFSTHYHELTDLSHKLEHVACYTVDVKEWDNKVIFMYKVIAGIADKSYGINVAEIAGIPKQVLTRAKEVLKELSEA